MTVYDQLNSRPVSKSFIFGFLAFSIFILSFALRGADMPWVYKIAVFYAGLLSASLLMLNSHSARRLSAAWIYSQKTALKLMALL